MSNCRSGRVHSRIYWWICGFQVMGSNYSTVFSFGSVWNWVLVLTLGGKYEEAGKSPDEFRRDEKCSELRKTVFSWGGGSKNKLTKIILIVKKACLFFFFFNKFSYGKSYFTTESFWLDFRRNFIIIDDITKDYRVLFSDEKDSEQSRQTYVRVLGKLYWDGLRILLGFLQQHVSVDFTAMQNKCYVLGGKK